MTGHKYIKQLIPAVVNLVYKKLLQCDITSRAFHTRTTVDETEPDEDYLHEETPQIKRRKMFLRWYLTRLCQDPTTMDFWRYLNKVGYVQPHVSSHYIGPMLTITQHDAQRASAPVPSEHRVYPSRRLHGLHTRYLDRGDDVAPAFIAAPKDRTRASR